MQDCAWLLLGTRIEMQPNSKTAATPIRKKWLDRYNYLAPIYAAARKSKHPKYYNSGETTAKILIVIVCLEDRMGIVSVPDRKRAGEIELGPDYQCPLCVVQTVADAVDTGWVRCPMLEGGFICFGCCVDLQGVARSADFEAHPYYDFFLDVANKTGKQIHDLRRKCLEHQVEILNAYLRDLRSQTETNNILASLGLVEEALKGC